MSCPVTRCLHFDGTSFARSGSNPSVVSQSIDWQLCAHVQSLGPSSRRSTVEVRGCLQAVQESPVGSQRPSVFI